MYQVPTRDLSIKEAAAAFFAAAKSLTSGNHSFVQPTIPHFDGHYDHWSMLMESFLRSNEYWGLVENGIGEPAADTILTDARTRVLEDQRLKDLKTKNSLFPAIDRVILKTILQKILPNRYGTR